MPDRPFADVSDAVLKELAARAVREWERSRAQQARILQDIVALRDEMQERLRRRGEAA